MPITRDHVIDFLRTRDETPDTPRPNLDVLVQELFPDVPIYVIRTHLPAPPGGRPRTRYQNADHIHTWVPDEGCYATVDQILRRARRKWPAADFGGNMVQGVYTNVRIVSMGQALSPANWDEGALRGEAQRICSYRSNDALPLLIMIVPELGRLNYNQTVEAPYDVVEILAVPDTQWTGVGMYTSREAYTEAQTVGTAHGTFLEAYMPRDMAQEPLVAAWRTRNAGNLPADDVIAADTAITLFMAEFRERNRNQLQGWAKTTEVGGVARLLMYPFRHGAGLTWSAENLFTMMRAGVIVNTVDVPQEVLVNVREVARIIATVNTTRQRFGTRLNELEAADQRDVQEVESLLANLQTIRRREGERAVELRALRCGIWGTIRQALDAMDGLSDTIAGFRGVNTCERDDATKLVVVTHPYAMDSEGKTCGDRNCENCTHAVHKVIVPPMKITVDLTARRYEEAVKLIGVDGTRRCHPHVMPRDYSVCWGSAGTMLAEHWGREDWTGFMRILLTWATQNNPREQELMESFSEAGHTRDPNIPKGWIVPDPAQTTIPIVAATAAPAAQETATT